MPPLYVPILRAKPGEIDGVGHLCPSTRQLIKPLLDIPRIEADTPLELQFRMADITRQVSEAWGTAQTFYFDLSRYPPDLVVDTGESTLEYLFLCARQHRLKAIPVAGPVSDRGPGEAYLHSISRIQKRDKRGVGLRIHYHAFSRTELLREEIEHLLHALDVSAAETDLILDAESLTVLPAEVANPNSMVNVLLQAISSVRRFNFRGIVVAASNFPEKTIRTAGGEPVICARNEVLIWKQLISADHLPIVQFGDYGVVFPQEIDPQGVVIAPAKIRLSTADSHLLFKGRPEQYRELCADAIACKQFRLQPPSWGRREIADCASGGGGTGNATSWVARDTNSHIETTAALTVRNMIAVDRLKAAPRAASHPWLQNVLFETVPEPE